MSETLKINLSEELCEILREYADKTYQVLDEEAEKAAVEAVKYLKTQAKGQNPWKEYSKGWAKTKVKSSLYGTTFFVHNAKHYRLTHLLENGHAIWNSPKARAGAFPHIKPAEEKAKKSFEERVRKRIEDLS